MTIKLVSFGEEDFSRLIQWINSPELLIQWGGSQLFSYPLNDRQLKRYWQMGQGDQARSKIFKVVNEAAEVVGHIELAAIDRVNGTASICRVFIASSQRGQGLCPEMIQRILEIGFEELGLRRLELRVYGFNTAAITCYEKVGLVREGLLRKSQRVGHVYWDTIIMGMLKEEWEARQKTRI